jgi:DNA-directed RNA polymerase specialized sigma24 family protein
VFVTPGVGNVKVRLMGKRDRRSDEALLGAAAADDKAFAVFYRRYERLVLAYFVRAVGGGELAADLTAETFAALVSSLSRFELPWH